MLLRWLWNGPNLKCAFEFRTRNVHFTLPDFWGVLKAPPLKAWLWNSSLVTLELTSLIPLVGPSAENPLAVKHLDNRL